MDSRNQTWEREREIPLSLQWIWVGDLVTKASRQPVMVVEWQIWRPKTRNQRIWRPKIWRMAKLRNWGLKEKILTCNLFRMGRVHQFSNPQNPPLEPISSVAVISNLQPTKPPLRLDGFWVGWCWILAVWSGGALILLCFHNICACDLYSYWHFKGFHVVLICLVAFSCRLI